MKQQEYFRYNVSAINLIDLKDEWLETDSLWSLGDIWKWAENTYDMTCLNKPDPVDIRRQGLLWQRSAKCSWGLDARWNNMGRRNTKVTLASIKT